MLEPAGSLDTGRAPTSANERRATVRYPVSLDASCQAPPGTKNACWRARVREISALGIGLVFQHPLEPSTLLEIDLETAGRSVVRTVLARVVHVEPDPEGGWLVGCAFITELNDAQLQPFRAERLHPAQPDGRRWVRFPCNVETVCYASETAPGEQIRARVLNISPGGIGLLVPCQFEPGTLLHFEPPAPPGQPVLWILIRVVRAIEHTNGDWFLGCEFAHQLDPGELSALLA